MPTRFPLVCRTPFLAAATAFLLAGCTTTGTPVTPPAFPGGMVPLAGPTAGGTAGVTTGATAGAAAGTTVSANAGATLATGAGGTLTRDAADAYVDAFQFALAQAGRPKTFTAAEREQLIQGLAQGFAKGDVQTQQALVNARATWTQTQAGWASMAPQEQAAFVDGVLAIGVGDQGASQLTGRAVATGSGGGQASSGGDSWTQEANEKCQNGSYEDKMFYCHGVITPSVPW